MWQVTDLRKEAQIARQRNLLLMLEFSRDDCPYCWKLGALFLLPMQRNSGYDGKILVRMLPVDYFGDSHRLRWTYVNHQGGATRNGISMTPTLLFLNADGIKISERLVGIWPEDFYGFYIDSRIDVARERL